MAALAHHEFLRRQKIDVRCVCPKDVKKMLLQQARTVYWKKWAAKHECEELKEGIWLEPAPALLREKTKEEWTEKHRNAARQLVLEGGWVQKRLGRMRVSAKPVTRRKTRKCTGYAIAQHGTKSDQ